MVRQYLLALESVLECHPELQRCVARCVDCGLEFLTDPRNAGREDLRCPFGCRARHRRECSKQRSVAYYRTAAGKQKKKQLNGQRTSRPRSDEGALSESSPSPSAGVDCESAGFPLPAEWNLAGVVLEEATLRKSRLLPYVRLVVNLIEGLHLGLQEVVQELRRDLRQHRMGRRKRADYVGGDVLQHPP